MSQPEPDWLRPLIADRWGLEVAAVDNFDGEHDLTRRLSLASGGFACAKVRNAAGDARRRTERELTAASLAATALPTASTWLTDDGANVVEYRGQLVWVTEWLGGIRWIDVPRPDDVLCRELGRTAARMVDALQPLEVEAATRHHWDLREVPASIAMHRDQITDERQAAIADRTLTLFERYAVPALSIAPTSALHQDLNDHNVLVERRGDQLAVSGVVDFGDLVCGPAISELAVAVAYAMLRRVHPLDAAAAVVGGWADERGRLTPEEAAAIVPLASGRLLVNALTWAARSGDQPAYAHARSAHTWATLHRLAAIPATFAQQRIAPCERRPIDIAGSIPAVPGASNLPVADLDPHDSRWDDIDPTDAHAIHSALPADARLVQHDTVRLDHGGFADGEGGPATIQLGVELLLDTDTPVVAPLAGEVVAAQPLLIEHEVDGRAFTTRWRDLATALTPGSVVAAGDPLGTAQAMVPLGLQTLNIRIGEGEAIPDFVRPADRVAWTSISNDPSALIGRVPAPVDPPLVDAVIKRNERLASSQRYYYREPATLVRSRDCALIDTNAHMYLDAINNVTHVGHANRRVVEAATRQMHRLNTNSRFVYQQMGDYAERLAATLPDPLEVVFLVCTGSEANDLALRIARQVTGNEQIVVIDGAYHGNTTAVTGISPDRYKGPGGQGPPPTTSEVPRPDRLRGAYGYDHPDPGSAYAADAEVVIDQLVAAENAPAAFIAESLMGTSGQIVHPDGYLRQVFATVRKAGGLCIADEVQVGFGRLGETFWGFELGGVIPDIVTMGKPMGNGHPIAAVVTTRKIADLFDQGMKYFNTFGGNPVSCAVADAVLDEIERQSLQARSTSVGRYFKSQLEELRTDDPRIVDVRGLGLYLGIEFAEPDTLEPMSWLARAVSERMLQRGVVVYPNGVLGNCLKLKPPMVFGPSDVDRFIAALRATLEEIR